MLRLFFQKTPFQSTISALIPQKKFFFPSFLPSKKKTETHNSIVIYSQVAARSGREMLKAVHCTTEHITNSTAALGGFIMWWLHLLVFSVRSTKQLFQIHLKRGLCICRATATSDRRSLNPTSHGDQKQSVERRAAGYQHEVSPRLERSFPSSQKKNIKLLLINNKGKLKKTPSSIFTLFQYRK